MGLCTRPAHSCCCGVGVSSYTAQGKHHRMSFSSFLKDRMTLCTCVLLCFSCVKSQNGSNVPSVSVLSDFHQILSVHCSDASDKPPQDRRMDQATTMFSSVILAFTSVVYRILSELLQYLLLYTYFTVLFCCWLLSSEFGKTSLWWSTMIHL